MGTAGNKLELFIAFEGLTILAMIFGMVEAMLAGVHPEWALNSIHFSPFPRLGPVV